MAARKKPKHLEKCKLFPYLREDIVSIQSMEQKIGWEITAFDLPKLWNLTQGDGVVIAVLDTGCDLNHLDLIKNLLPGRNFVNPKLPPEDDNGHGSHSTGIICAENNDIGMVGVAPKAKVIPIKVLDKNGSGSLTYVEQGIYWAADQKVDFISLSLGSPKPLPNIYKAIKYAIKKGCVVFCAAGNAGQTHDIFYPANYPETIGIGAIDSSFDRANFSSTGNDLDFLAPGVKIFSTVPDNWYAILSGTSMATPFLVGVCALLLSYVRRNKLKIKLKTADDYRNILKKHTIPTNSPDFAGKKFFEGYGIIDPRNLATWVKS